jgi:hypothetical protein
VIANLPCDHDKHHRIVTNNYLELSGYEGEVYALGDCASIPNPHTGKPYPPTAQHAIRQGKVAAKNVVYSIERKRKKQMFDYKTKGMMTEIGKRTGVAELFGFKIHGLIAWWLWRTFYLANLPTIKKKLKVMGDWTMDLVFRSDVSMIKRSENEYMRNRAGMFFVNKESHHIILICPLNQILPFTFQIMSSLLSLLLLTISKFFLIYRFLLFLYITPKIIRLIQNYN